MLNKLNRALIKQHSLEIIVTDELVKAVAKKGHDPKFGVRPLARVIQDDVQTQIADTLLLEPTPYNICIYIDPLEI